MTVKVDADLDSDLSVPITFTDDADAPPESGEYRVTGLTTNNDLIIAADGDSEPDSATFTISTKADAESDDEKVTLGIGSLPTGILAGPDATFVIAERRTPGQPDAPTLKPVFDGLAVSWDRPGDAFDGLATYNLRYQDSATEDTTQWTDAEYGGTAREATVTGLSAGVEYNVQVQASNGTGYDGGWSGSATAFVCHEDMGALTLGTYTREGRLASDCLSVNSDLAKYGIDVYARYYTFQIDQAQRVRVELSGVLDNIPGGGATAVFLVSGSGPEGTVVAGSSGGIPAIVEVELDPGTYTVEATEPFGAQSGTFTLNAIVLNRGPVFDETAPTRSVAENSAGGTNVVNPADPGQNDDPVSATDPEGDTPLTYSFATDAEGVLQDAEARFTIDSATGLISVAAGAVLDFETESSHIVQVGVSDGMKGNDTPDPDNIIDTTIDVTINLTDANDPGVVSLSWPHAYLGYALEATLQDQDQVTASTESWQWQSADPSSDLSDASSWSDISGAISDSYTPVAGDAGKALRATVTYDDDSFGSGQTADSVSTSAVATESNNAPAIDEGTSANRNVPENSPEGTAVGAAFTVTDGNDQILRFTLTGEDAETFRVNSQGQTAQITVGPEVDLNYEAEKNTYDITLTVSDTKDAGGHNDLDFPDYTDAIIVDATIDVTISLTNAPDRPSKPDAPTLTSDMGDVTLNWTAPAVHGPSAITDYDVRYRWLGWKDRPFTGTGLTTTITGLEPGIRYEAQVRATNADGAGPWSDSGVIALPECVTYLGTLTGTVDFADERSTWVSGCTSSQRSNTLARFFTFQVDRDVSVYMRGTSWPSSKLYLLQGDHTSTTVLAQDGSRISDGEITQDLTANTSYSLEYSPVCSSDSLTCGLNQKTAVTIRPQLAFLEDLDASDGITTTRILEENSALGTNVGPPLQVTDRDNDTLRYTFSGTDAGFFAIDEITGQLTNTTVLATASPQDNDQDNSYEVTVTADDRVNPSRSRGSTAAIQVTIAVIDPNAAVTNAAPSFDDGDTTSRTVAENTVSVGAALAVTDSDGTSFVFTIVGGSAHLFNIDNNGQLTTGYSDGLDYEAGDSYSMIVGVSDQKDDDGVVDNVIDDFITVTVNVTDDDTEAPGKPDAPALAPGNRAVLAVWDPPTNSGPTISEYDVEYRLSSDSTWTSWTFTGASTQTLITGLSSNTAYQVRVRATNDEGTGPWSDPATVTTGTGTVNSSPVFVQGTGQDLYTGTNWQAGYVVGTPVKAVDADGDTITYSLSDDSNGKFSIDGSTGQVETSGTVNGSYDITVLATDSTGLSSSIALRTRGVGTPGLPTYYQLAIPTQTITDTAFVVRYAGWAGSNPDWIDIRFREKGSGDPWTVREQVPTFDWEGGYDALRVTGLTPETTYEIHMRGVIEGQPVTGLWADIVALSPDNDKIPYPTTLEQRTPVTISFSARSYAATQGSGQVPITFFLDKPASHGFDFYIRTGGLGFGIDEASTPALDCDSTGYCKIHFDAEKQWTTILTQHEDARYSHSGTFTIHEPSLPSFVTVKGISQVDVAYFNRPEDEPERPQDTPEYLFDFTAPVYSVEEGKGVIVGVGLQRARPDWTFSNNLIWSYKASPALEALEIPINLVPLDSTARTDYSVNGLTDGKVVFDVGDTFKTFSITANSDTNSFDERVRLEFGAPTDTYKLGGGGSRALTIRDDEPQIELTAYLLGTTDPAEVAEGGSQSVEVTASFLGGATPPGPSTITISVAGETAAAGDFAAVSNFDITILDGANSATGSFTLAPVDDTDSELDETVVISGSTTANHQVTPTTATIVDNEQRVVLSLNPASRQEHAQNHASTITVTAELSPATARITPTLVNVSVEDGTANLGEFLDYRLLDGGSFDITIPANQTSAARSFRIVPVGSGPAAEGDETVLVTGSNADGLAVVGATLTITENRPAPNEVRLYLSPSTISEGDDDVVIRVNVDRWHTDGFTWGTPTTVNVEMVAGTATEGDDYTAIDDFTMTLIGTNGTHYVNLNQFHDIDIEGDETLEFRVTSAHNEVYGNVPNSQGATLTIEDNEPRIVWELYKTGVVETDDAQEYELELTARLAGTRPLPVDTNLAVVVGEDTSKGYRSARIGEDFEAVAPFDLVIPADGNRSNTHRFTLKVVKGKENETLAITATSPDLPPDHCPFPAYNPPSPRVNCFYTIPEVIFTIEELGGPPQQQQGEREVILSVSPVSLEERDGPTAVTVRATHEGTPPDSPATVTLFPSGSAAPGADYYALITGVTVTIPANQPLAETEISITPVRDEAVEGNETIEISGTSAGYTVTPASVTLVDAESITTVAFESASYAVVEGGDPVSVTVNIYPVSNEAVAIPIGITPPCGTGSPACTVGGDKFNNGTLTIASGSGTASFTLLHTTDTDLVDETVELSFGTLPDGITAGTPTTATVNLEDNGASLFDDLGQGDEGEEIPIDVLDNDSPGTNVSISDVTIDSEYGLEHGNVELDIDVNSETYGSVVYTAHDEDFNGEDQFRYEVQGTGESATVMVQVGPVNDGPEALGNLDDEEMDEEEPPRLVEVVENFRDIDGDPLTIEVSSQPDGIVTVSYLNPVIIDPEAVGRTMVTVKATDPDGLYATRTFQVTVTSLPDSQPQPQPPAPPRPAPEPEPEVPPTPTPEPEPPPTPLPEPTPEPTATPGPQTALRPGPAFGGHLVKREVAENTPAGALLGDPVTATAAVGELLIYTLTGTDAKFFDIDADTGQIRTGEPLDFEDPQDKDEDNVYLMAVQAADERGRTSSAAVWITVTDVVEVPVTAGLAPTPTPTPAPTATVEPTPIEAPSPAPEPTPELAERPAPTAVPPVEPVSAAVPDEEGRSSLWWLLLLLILLLLAIAAWIVHRAYKKGRERA